MYDYISRHNAVHFQTGKLGGFQQDLGGTAAVKSKGRGEKSDPGVDSRAARGTKMNLTKRADSREARGGKTNAAMYMSNEHGYLKYVLCI